MEDVGLQAEAANSCLYNEVSQFSRNIAATRETPTSKVSRAYRELFSQLAEQLDDTLKRDREINSLPVSRDRRLLEMFHSADVSDSD